MPAILPLIRHSAPKAFVSPVLRPFFVTISFEGDRHELNVLAFKSCDAISNAIDLLFDGTEEMPVGGLEIKVSPTDALPLAA